MHPAVRGLVRHESPEVRAQAVRLLARAGDPSMTTEVERLLYDPHLEVRTEALLYLTQHAHVDPLERIEQLGDFPDFSLRAAMAAFLAQARAGAEPRRGARDSSSAMVTESGRGGPAHAARGRAAARRGARSCSSASCKSCSRIRTRKSSAAAIRAVGRLRKRSLVPRVIERLAQPG